MGMGILTVNWLGSNRGGFDDSKRIARPTIERRPEKPEHPELVVFCTRSNKIAERIRINDSSLPFVAQNDLAAIVSILTDCSDHDIVRNEAANLLARSSYQDLAPVLISVLNNPDEGSRFRGFATQHLGMVASRSASQSDLAVVRLRSGLTDQHVEVRREALLALVRLKDQTAARTAISWLNSTSKTENDLRDVAIRCIQELNLREHAPTIRKYLADADEAIRIQAIVTLSQWNDEESVPCFEEAAISSHARIQRAGAAALRRLGRPVPVLAMQTQNQVMNKGAPPTERKSVGCCGQK